MQMDMSIKKPWGMDTPPPNDDLKVVNTMDRMEKIIYAGAVVTVVIVLTGIIYFVYLIKGGFKSGDQTPKHQISEQQ